MAIRPKKPRRTLRTRQAEIRREAEKGYKKDPGYKTLKPKKKKLPHEKLLDKYLKGDIPATIPWGSKKLKDKIKDLLKKKNNPAARTGPIKSKTKKKPGFKDVMGPRQTRKQPKAVPGGPYKPKKGPKYMKPMSKRKK